MNTQERFNYTIKGQWLALIRQRNMAPITEQLDIDKEIYQLKIHWKAIYHKEGGK